LVALVVNVLQGERGSGEKMPVPKGVDKRKYDDCLERVNTRGGRYNRYAVCAASLKRTKRRGKRR
jgi:hypothetical protein